MSLENYSVAVRINLVENVSKGLVALGSKFALLNNQSSLFQSKLAALRSQITTGALLFGGGIALASPFIYATIQAGKLQQQLKGVQLATSATNEQMEEFRRTVDKVATTSIFKSVDIAAMAKMLATANTFNPNQVEQLLPSFAKFATTQQLLKGTPISKSTEQAIQLAEITGHFTPQSINSTLDAFTKLSLLMPGSVDKVLSAFKYAEGTMKNVMGVSDDNTLLMVAMLQRMGVQGTRAGTQMLAMISRTIPQVFGSGLWAGQSQQMLAKMGMLNSMGTPDVFTKGKFDPLKFFNKLGTYVTKEFKTHPEDIARSNIMKSMQMTFGTTGTRIASIVSTPAAIEQFKQLQQTFARFPNLEVISSQMDDLMNKQLPQATNNLTTLFTSLGYALLPTVTVQLKSFNGVIQSLIVYIDTHQETVARFEKAILALSGAMIVGGALIMIRAAIMGLLIPIQVLSGFFTLLMPAIAGAIGAISIPGLIVIGVLAAVGIALYETYKHWDYIKAKFQQLNAYLNSFKGFSTIEAGLKLVGHVILDMLIPIRQLVFLVNHIKQLFNFFSSNNNHETANLVSHDNINADKSWKKVGIPNYSLYINPRYDKLLKQVPNNINHQSYINNTNNINYDMSPKPIFNNVHYNFNKNPVQHGSMGRDAPIHINLHMDGQKIATAVVKNITNQANNVPNSGSVFDSRLSPVPTILNNMGY